MLESIKRKKSVTAYISKHSWEVDESTAFEAGYMKNQAIYLNETEDYHDAIFLSNHDQNRILSVLDRDINKGKLAAAMLLTMPGTPYLYYGEEIGMLGMKPDPNIREPFLWKDAQNDTERAKWINSEYSLESTVDPLSRQMEDSLSIFNHYKSLIRIRNTSKALSFGDFAQANYGNSSVISYYRKKDKEHLLIIHNLSDRQISLQLKDEDVGLTNTLFSTCGETVQNHQIDMEAYSSIILN